MTPPLHARGLGRQLGGRWLYRGLDLDLPPRTITVVVGPNGSGKSTLLRDLAGLARPAAGEIWLSGQPLADLRPAERARSLAYLPQDTPLAHDLAVAELVMLGRAPYLPRLGGPGPDDRAAVDEALAAVGLAGAAERGVLGLSGGERQRVMLARMLATRAPVLLLDEPTRALDVGQELDFLALCRRLTDQGATIAAAIHDLDLARRHADQVLLLPGDGRGHPRIGAPAAVLVHGALAEVFGVDAREVDGHLVFERARA